MDKVNKERIKARLHELGFDYQAEEKLMGQLCFSPATFDLPFHKVSGEDECSFLVHLACDIAGNYVVTDYSACLRKGLVLDLPSTKIAQRMAGIDWNRLAFFRCSSSVTVELSVLEEAYDILQEVGKLEESSMVLYKYWAGTSLEILIPGLASLRNRYELTQRFYVSDQHSPISSDEAIRFLQNRWMERQMQQSRLQGRQAISGTQKSGSRKNNKRKSNSKK